MMMKDTGRNGRLVILLVLLFLFLGIAQTVQAQGVIFGEQVGPGESIQSDVLLSGNDVRLMGQVDGDVFILGRSVIVDGDVSGSLFVIADRVLLNGEIDGSVYVGAVSLQVGETAVTQRSLFFLGLSLLMERGSSVGRDLYALTFGARLAGDVGRDTQAVIGIYEVVRFLLSGVNQATTGQSVSFLEPGLTIDTRSRGTTYRIQTQTQAEPDPRLAAAGDWFARQGRLLAGYLLVGLLTLWLRPGWLESWAGQVRQRPLPVFGFGLSAYIIGFVGSGLVLAILIAIGAGLALATLWGLAFTWWGISISLLSLAFWVFILFVSYLSKAIIAYWFGGWLLGRLLTDFQSRTWSLLLGLFLFILLAGIPYAGWALSMLVTLFGLGAVVAAFLDRRVKWVGTAVD
jgi:hypothetical protein